MKTSSPYFRTSSLGVELAPDLKSLQLGVDEKVSSPVPPVAERLEIVVRNELPACEWHGVHISPRNGDAPALWFYVIDAVSVIVRIGPPPEKLISLEII